MLKTDPIKRLPKIVDPRKMALSSASFQRFLEGSDLPRLSEVTDAVLSIMVDISFSYDWHHRKIVQGTVCADLELQCQRCLKSMVVQLESKVHLAVVKDEEQAGRLPKSVEPWFVEEDEGDLHAALEDEILLSLPLVPRHVNECVSVTDMKFGEEIEESPTVNPFDVLAQLKKD
ncbi:MAG: hypothetical protein ACI93R_002257 [Flavobacteriales bacterium]|jgi:uncharacterized protein